MLVQKVSIKSAHEIVCRIAFLWLTASALSNLVSRAFTDMIESNDGGDPLSTGKGVGPGATMKRCHLLPPTLAPLES